MPVAAQGFLKKWRGSLIWMTYVVGLSPAVWYFYRGATGGLGADPVKTFELILGLWAFRFLILTLAVTPVRDLIGWNLVPFRRALGLICFYYVLFHFSVYLLLDQAMDMAEVLEDVTKRPFIMFGMAAFIILIPLALTSNRASIRRLGMNWIRLHRMIYVVAITAILHFALATKVFEVEQTIYLVMLGILLLYRLYKRTMPRSRQTANRQRSKSADWISPPASASKK